MAVTSSSKLRWFNADSTAEFDFQTLFSENTAFVDQTYGDDSTAVVGNMALPFATPAAAETAVSSGQTIRFRAGTWTISGLGKDGIHYYFEPGCIITPDGTLFNDVGVPIEFRVTGGDFLNVVNRICYFSAASTAYFRIHKLSVANNHISCFEVINADSKIVVVGDYLEQDITSYSDGTEAIFMTDTADAGEIHAYFKHVVSGDRVTYARDGGKLYFTCDYFYDITTTQLKSMKEAFYVRFGGQLFVNINTLRTDTAASPTYLVESQTTGSGNCVININDGILSKSYANAPFVTVNAARIELTGNITYEDIGVGKPLIYKGVGTGNAFIKFSGQMVNKNQLAGAHGIVSTATKGGSLSDIDIEAGSSIKLNSVAVGLGAKAISGANNHRLFSNTVTNGALDGTNLITGTAAIVDAAAKSD